MIFQHRCALSDGLCGHPCFYAVQALDHREPNIGSTQCPCRFRQLCAPLSKNVAPNCPTATTPCVALPISLLRLSRHNGRSRCPEFDYFTMTQGQADRGLSIKAVLGPPCMPSLRATACLRPGSQLDLASSRPWTACQRQMKALPARSTSTSVMPWTRWGDVERTLSAGDLYRRLHQPDSRASASIGPCRSNGTRPPRPASIGGARSAPFDCVGLIYL
ncbi:hypothetical protein J2X50_001844 [Aminobacter sp. BE322]